MSLYTVKFTTKHIVTRYNERREPIETIETETPVTMHGLPITTAQSYSKCDNFTMERGQPVFNEEKSTYKYVAPPVNRKPKGNWSNKSMPAIKKASAKIKADKLSMAATGDLSGAIS